MSTSPRSVNNWSRIESCFSSSWIDRVISRTLGWAIVPAATSSRWS
jgi:hypothetical protein